MTSSLEQMKHPREMTTPEDIRREEWRFDFAPVGRSAQDDLQRTYRACFEADGQSSCNYRTYCNGLRVMFALAMHMCWPTTTPPSIVDGSRTSPGPSAFLRSGGKKLRDRNERIV
jgi:hypothetical protein